MKKRQPRAATADTAAGNSAQSLSDYIFLRLQERKLLCIGDDSFCCSEDDAYYLSMLDYPPVMRILSQSEAEPYRYLIPINARKFTLAATDFGRDLQPRALCCAVAFVILCCRADNMMDDGSEEDRAEVLRMLDWENGCGGFCQGEKQVARNFTEAVLAELGAFLHTVRLSDPCAYEQLILDLRRTAEAERCSYTSVGKTDDLQNAIDKSVLFVLTSFRIAMGGRLSPEEEQYCRAVGEAMSMLDDLLDMEEDAARGQINSVLCMIDGSQDVTAVIDRSFQKLDALLDTIKSAFGAEFYTFFMDELRLWTLSNPAVKRMTWLHE